MCKCLFIFKMCKDETTKQRNNLRTSGVLNWAGESYAILEGHPGASESAIHD